MADAAVVVPGRALPFALGFALASAFAPHFAAAQSCGTHCGFERWAVKSLSDLDRGHVDFAPERRLPDVTLPATRLARLQPRRPVELTTYEVRALLIGWK